MKMINSLLRRFGVQIVPATTAKMWHERANVMAVTGYPSKVRAVEHFRKAAEWADR